MAINDEPRSGERPHYAVAPLCGSCPVSIYRHIDCVVQANVRIFKEVPGFTSNEPIPKILKQLLNNVIWSFYGFVENYFNI